jgi:hypothetical protein
MALSNDDRDGIEWGGSFTPDPEDVRHFGADAGAHHDRYVRCGCGCESADDGPPLRNLRGYEAMLIIEFRAVEMTP